MPFQTYLRPDLLIIDAYGLKPLVSPGPNNKYEVIYERCEPGSVMLTSNRAPEGWPELFGDPLLTKTSL